jgi:hypothetical protein
MVAKIQKSSDLGKIWFPSRLRCYELISIVWEPCYDPSDHIISCLSCYFILTPHTHTHTHTRREGAILQSPCPSVSPSVRPFTLSLKMSQLLLEEMILFLICGFGMVTCTMSPLSRFTAHLLPVYRVT